MSTPVIYSLSNDRDKEIQRVIHPLQVQNLTILKGLL